MIESNWVPILSQRYVVHYNRLWLYSGSSPPTWMKDSNKQPDDQYTPDPPRQMAVSTPDNCLQTQRRSQRHRCPPDRFAYLCTHSKIFKRGNSVKEQWYWPLSHSNLWTIVRFVKLSCTSICNINCYYYLLLISACFNYEKASISYVWMLM